MLDKGNITNHNNKCGLLMSSVEDAGHILAGFPQMSSYAIMKTMSPPGYHNDFVATHALGYMSY